MGKFNMSCALFDLVWYKASSMAVNLRMMLSDSVFTGLPALSRRPFNSWSCVRVLRIRRVAFWGSSDFFRTLHKERFLPSYLASSHLLLGTASMYKVLSGKS